jgi:hypothetical protein
MKYFVAHLFALVISMNVSAQSNALEAPRSNLSPAELAELKLMDQFNNFMMQSHSQFAKGQLKEFIGLGGEQRYFSNTWVIGGAVNPSNVTISDNYVFNFDFKEGELYAQWKDTAIVVNSNYLKSFFLMKDGTMHYFVRASYIQTNHFFESLGYEPDKANPTVQLLKLRTIKEVKVNRNDYYVNSTGDYSNKLDNDVVYYLVLADQSFRKIKLSRKSLEEALAAYKGKVNEYLAQVSRINEETVAGLIRYINE